MGTFTSSEVSPAKSSTATATSSTAYTAGKRRKNLDKYISGIHKSAAINTVSVGKTKIISTELTKNHAETGVKKPKARNSGSRKNRDLENSPM